MNQPWAVAGIVAGSLAGLVREAGTVSAATPGAARPYRNQYAQPTKTSAPTALPSPAGLCGSVDEGMARAREAISSGSAAAALERLLESCG